MGIRNRDGALYAATGIDNAGLYEGRREAMGIIKAMAGQITSFDVFSGIGISAATAFASAAKSSYDFEKEFRKNMLEVATISTQVEGSMTDFMNQVMSITQEIPVTAPEAAKALYQIVSAGHDGANGMNVLEVAAKSAIGGITDTVTAADAITTLLNAYKLSADDAEKVSDQLFTTARLGKTTFGELGQSIAQVAPIAAAYGVEMDQVLAAVATLTKSGTPTAQAMTQIRASIIGTSKVLGDGAFDSMTFQEALAEIAKRAGGSEAELRKLIPEVEAVNGVLGLTGIKAQDAADHLKEMNNSVGATEAAFKLMMNDVDKQMTLLSNNIQAALRPMGQAILKEVSEVATAFNEAFDNGDAKEAMKTLGDLIVIVTGAFIGYKGAVLASTAVQRINIAILRQAVLERQLEKVALLNGVVGHQAMTAAQLKEIAARKIVISTIKVQTAAMLKNLAAFATNPYIWAAAAISFLGYQVYKYATQATAAEKAQKRFNDRIDEQKQSKEELKNKTEELLKVARDENETGLQRNKALNALKELYPQIFAKYDIETLKLIDLIKLQKELNKARGNQEIQTNKDNLSDAKKNLDDLRLKLSKLSEEQAISPSGQKGGLIAKLQEQILVAEKEIESFRDVVKKDAEDIWNTSPKEVKIISLEKNIESLKIEQEELNTLINGEKEGGNPIAGIAFPFDIARLEVVNGLIKEQSEELNSLKKISNPNGTVACSSVSKEINDTTTNIAKLKQELSDLRSGKTSVEAGKTVQSAIEEKTKELKAAEEALSTLTGKDGAADKKSSDEQKKSLEARKKLNEELLSLRMQNQQAEINLMAEGREKRLAQIEFDYDSEIAAILAKEKEWKEAQSGKLTEDQTKEIHVSFLNSYVKKEKSTATVDKDQFEAEKQAMNEYLAAYGDYQEKRKAITEKYNDLIAKATTQGEKLSLGEEMKKSLATVDDEVSKKTSIITKLFSDMSNRTSADIRVIADEAQKMLDYVNSGEFKTDDNGKGLFGMTKEQFDVLAKSQEQLQSVEDEIANVRHEADQCETSFNKVSGGLKKVFSAGDDSKKLKEGLEEISQGMNDVMQAGQFLADSFSAIGDAFGSDLMSGIADGLNVAMDAMSSAMDGAKAGAMFGPIGAAAGAAIGMVTSLATSIAKIHDAKNEKRIQRLQDQIETLERSYDMLGDSIEKAYSKDASKLIEDQNKLLEQQKVLIQQQILEEDDKKKTDKDKIKDWQNQLEEIDKTLADNKEKAIDSIFGEDLNSAIDNFAQAYANAWASNEDKAESAKNSVRNMMRQMVTESIKAAMESSKSMEKIRDKLKEFYSDNVLSGWEQDYIYNMAEDLQKELDRQFGWADSLMKDEQKTEEEVSDNTLKGAYAKASQESIDLLAGQTGAMRMVVEDIKNNMQPIREQMQFIYDLQKEGWQDVKAIRDLTVKVDKNTEQIAENTKQIRETMGEIGKDTRRSANVLDGGRIDVNIKGM